MADKFRTYPRTSFNSLGIYWSPHRMKIVCAQRKNYLRTKEKLSTQSAKILSAQKNNFVRKEFFF